MLSFEDKLLKKICECKRFSSRRLIKNFPTRIGKGARLMIVFENCQVPTTGTIERTAESGRPQAVRTADNIAAVEKLVQSQEDKPQTHLSTRQISKKLRIPRTTVRRIIHNDLRLKCLKKRRAQELVVVWKDLERHIVDTAIDQWRRRLTACITAKGGHFEHSL